MVSQYWVVRKSPNVSVLLYHIVCPAKYRKVVISDEVDVKIREICLEMAKRYQIHFLEIGTDKDHVHFLVQSVPTYSPTKIVRMIKSITAREIFRTMPEIKKELWGGEFWTDGYFINTVGKRGNENTIRRYVQNQDKKAQYQTLHHEQLTLF